ncbi:MAG: pyridoxal-phosphate dependent enzyme, partial [Acidobacteriota bacterium]
MPPTIATPVTIDDIRAAAERIKPIARRTPVLNSHTFDREAGAEVFFKCENMQKGGAFKIRGAANFIYSIPTADRARGVVAFSSGNHAQAVAIAAQSLGIPATIAMASDAPRAKAEATRARGARIVTYDRFREDRVAVGKKLAEETGARGCGRSIPPLM